MNRSGLKIIAAALIALPAALRAEFVSIPTILDVHGLNMGKISCDSGSIDYGSITGSAHNEACWLAQQGFATMDSSYSDYYFDWALRDLCGPACAQITAFTWGSHIKDSRESVDALKEAIIQTGESARSKGAPFIIIAHSWGTVLTAQALAELEDEDRDGGFTVDKLVTMGSPLSTVLYDAARAGLISNQGFLPEPRRARSIEKWVNYYASRDLISGKIPFATENVRIDADDSDYKDMEGQVRIMAAAYIPYAMEDVKNFSYATEVRNWHMAYFSQTSTYLNSVQRYLNIDAVSTYAADYFRP